ncbi:hypothetical protein [Pseudoalteromonas sp. MMG012]|uniref:hypothetical protein n=1 Tax=Pseudoalteromonas sp. MMG012 TaxID=2822686 RepID=UPI001B3A79F3|nr:hypothetical protein [Pseudoalteromonas sp. MMG012]MBQ4849217.1 hypothetical protein [Pseudoalteromonas sp. MMG012]
MVRQQYLLLFLVLSLLSFLSFGNYHVLPVNIIFELLVLFAFFCVVKRMDLVVWGIFSLSAGYFIVSFLLGQIRGVHPSDFLLAYKAFFYLSILCFFSSKVLFTSDILKKFWYLMLSLFFLKYVVWIAIGAGFRPGIFTENNFEVMFLLFVGVAVWGLRNSLSASEWILLGVIIFLSGSRSGIICFLAMFVLLTIKEMNWKVIFQIFVAGLIGIGVIAIFISRLSGGSAEDIDRVVFFQGFLVAISDWGWWQFLFGSQVLTPLPDEVCNRLVFYQTLFSAKSPDICYSVILHSYITRTIFDHGFFGFFFIFFVINGLMKLSQVTLKARLTVIVILFLNGASVSSVNSVYAVMGIILILTALYPHRYEYEKKKLNLRREVSNEHG